MSTRVMIHQWSDGEAERKSFKVGFNLIGTLAGQIPIIGKLCILGLGKPIWDTEKRLESWSVYCYQRRVLSQDVQLQRQILMGPRRGWSLAPYCSIRETNIDGKEGVRSLVMCGPDRRDSPDVPLARSRYLSNNWQLFSKESVSQRCQEYSRQFRTICGQKWMMKSHNDSFFLSPQRQWGLIIYTRDTKNVFPFYTSSHNYTDSR